MEYFLQCPHCQNPATDVWRFFIFPGWLAMRKCRHCNNKISFDRKTVHLMIYGFSFAMIWGIFVPVYPALNAAFIVLCTFFPIFIGRKLFVKKPTK